MLFELHIIEFAVRDFLLVSKRSGTYITNKKESIRQKICTRKLVCTCWLDGPYIVVHYTCVDSRYWYSYFKWNRLHVQLEIIIGGVRLLIFLQTGDSS